MRGDPDLERVRIMEKDHDPDAFPAVQMSFITKLAGRITELESALLDHRSDLHQGSLRPCPTCRKSAGILGLSVPDHCATATLDRRAVMAKEEQMMADRARERDEALHGKPVVYGEGAAHE